MYVERRRRSRVGKMVSPVGRLMRCRIVMGRSLDGLCRYSQHYLAGRRNLVSHSNERNFGIYIPQKWICLKQQRLRVRCEALCLSQKAATKSVETSIWQL